MAKYFVCSDIHGAESRLESALTRQSDIDTVVVCGDLEMEVYDVEEIIRRCTSRSIDILMVRGNCDPWFSSSSRIPDQITLTFNTKHKALVMHSHLYRASSELMAYAAKENACDIVIYGHTHRQTDKEVYGIRFLNPGAMKNGNYLIIETSGKGDLEVTLY